MTEFADDSGQVLAAFVAGLDFEAIPEPVVRRTEELLLDWIGCALAGKDARPVRAMQNLAREMGPRSGRSEILTNREATSPLFAAMVNATASHVVEQDDLHNSSVLHPGTVVFPAALAVTQATAGNGCEFLTAAIAGYEAGIRVGEFLGRSHYAKFHTTATAGTVAAAAAAARMLRLTPCATQHAFGSAGTQAAGLWEFLSEATDTKQLHAAKAAANGLIAAYLASDGFTGARRIFDGERGMGATLSEAVQPAALTDRLGERWAVVETSFKHHASCRHTHPAADALLNVIDEHEIRADAIDTITAHVHQAAIDVLDRVAVPESVHQAKFSMRTVLALIALRRSAQVDDFESCLEDEDLARLRDRVSMVFDADVDRQYPASWLGRVTVRLKSGAVHAGQTDVPRGDPGNALGRGELEAKAKRLARFRQGASDSEVARLIERVWGIATADEVGRLLS